MYEDFDPKLSNLIPSFKSLLSTFLPNAAMADEKKPCRENFPLSPSLALSFFLTIPFTIYSLHTQSTCFQFSFSCKYITFLIPFSCPTSS